MTPAQKQSIAKAVIDDVFSRYINNVQFWIDLGIPQGTVFTSITGRQNYGWALELVSSTGVKYLFGRFIALGGTVPANGFVGVFASDVPVAGLTYSQSINFTTPTVKIEIPKPILPITKYIDFLNNSKLYNSFISNVKTEMNKKYTVSVIKDFIYGMLKNYTDGMVIFDYYQWQGNDDRENFEFRLYKNFYLRVFGKVGETLVCKSIELDYHLFTDIAGATLLDNGIMIAGNAQTDTAGTYIRYGYMIHGNNCNLEAYIQKLQEDSNFSLTPIEFPEYEDIKQDLAENKAFLGKDGKSIQERFNDSLAGYRSFYSGMKDVLGLTDAQVEFLSQRDAQRDTQAIIDSQSLALSAEMSTQNAEVQKQQYQQSQANESEKQTEKEEQKTEKEKQAAIQAERNKTTNADYIKKAYNSYISALKKVNAYCGTSVPAPTYSTFASNFATLGSQTEWSYDLKGTQSVTPVLDELTDKYLTGYRYYYKLTVKDSNKDGVIDGLSIDPLTITNQYASDSGAIADSEKVAYTDDTGLNTDNISPGEELSTATNTQDDIPVSALDVATAVGRFGTRFNLFLQLFDTFRTEVGANEEKTMKEMYKQNALFADQLAEIKARNETDKLIPQYLKDISEKDMDSNLNINMSGVSEGLANIVTKIDDGNKLLTNHYTLHEERENKRVEREEKAFNDLHGEDITETVTLKGVLNEDGSQKVIDLPQGHYKALKAVGYYQKQSEELYDVESNNEAGNFLADVEETGENLNISSDDISHTVSEDYVESTEFGEFQYVVDINKQYNDKVLEFIDTAFKLPDSE